MRPLSNVLSEAIVQALEDLELCKNDPEYVINFSKWHEFIYIDGDQFSREKQVCSVCFAGSVMAQSLGVPSKKDFAPGDFKDKNTQNMLYALDKIRQGNIDQALYRLSIPLGNLPKYVKVNDEDYTEFKLDMNKIVTLLKENNL